MRAFKELENLSDTDLSRKRAELELELVKLRAQVATGTAPKNTMQVRRNRRTIARILTLKRQRVLASLKGGQPEISEIKGRNKKHE